MAHLTHEFSEKFSVPRACLFQALTDENELDRWFAQHAEVEPHAGGQFRFWGIHTHGAPTRAQATQKVVRIEAPRLLAFSWRLEERESEVTLQLEAVDDGASTLLQGRHHFPDSPDVPRPLDLVDDLWRMTFANLRAHLAGGAGVCMADFSDPITRIRQTVSISAAREQVYQALLDPAFLEKWLGGKSVVEPRVGGRYSYGWEYEVRGKTVHGGPTKILEMVEDTKLVTDWPNWRGDPEMPTQRVTWLLEPVGDQTRVILIHEPFERTADLSDYPQGWAYFLAGLKSGIEEGTQPT